jgi:hypothetical protein
VATETDAARDRVLAARAALGEELETLEASARVAVDIPAKIRRSPAKAAAVAGGAAFVVLGGPKRVFRAGKHAVFGRPSPLPDAMLPDEIEQTLRALGEDGDKVRGALERDFAAYVRKASRDRASLRTLLLLSVARPVMTQGTKAAAKRFFRTDDETFEGRLNEVRERMKRQTTGDHEDPSKGSAEDASRA